MTEQKPRRSQMTAKEIEKTDKPELSKRADLTKAEARAKLDNLKTTSRNFIVGKAAFYRACWDAHIHRLHKYFDGMGSEEALLESLGQDKIGITTYREACRIYKQFLDRVRLLPEFADNKIAAEDYTEQLVDKAYTAVGANGSYLGELARTKVVRGTKRETEENIEEAKEIYVDDKTKTIKDFSKSTKKKFGVINAEAAERRSASEVARGAKRAAKAVGIEGDKFMINLRFEASLAPSIVAKLEGISTSLGMRTKYADMSSDEIGTLFMTALKRLEKEAEIPKEIEARKAYVIQRAVEMTHGLTGVKVSDEVMDSVMGDIRKVVAPLAEA